MGWDKGRYYTRSKKVKGRVVREYFGTGEMADLIAKLDTAIREQREMERAFQRFERDEMEKLDLEMKALSKKIDLVAGAALLAAGFHRHNRGDWRKQRERANHA